MTVAPNALTRLGETPERVFELLSHRATPLRTVPLPKVTTNELTPSPTDNAALSKPIPSPMTRTAHTMKALAASSSKANTSAASVIAVAKIPSTQAAGAGMSATSARRSSRKPAEKTM